MKKRIDTLEFYRRSEVVNTFEIDRYRTPRGNLRYGLQNQMVFDLLKQTSDPILEIAGGSGRFTRQLALQDRNIFVVDASFAMICSNRKSITKEARSPHYVQAVGEHLPFRDEMFETILCVDMFSHVKKPEPILKEMVRVLKKGGMLVMNFTNKNSLMGLGATFLSNPLRLLVGKKDVYSVYHASKRFLKMMDDAGLKRLKTTGLFFMDTRLYRFHFGEKFHQWAVKVENWMTRRECRFLYEQIWVKAIRV